MLETLATARLVGMAIACVWSLAWGWYFERENILWAMGLKSYRRHRRGR